MEREGMKDVLSEFSCVYQDYYLSIACVSIWFELFQYENIDDFRQAMLIACKHKTSVKFPTPYQVSDALIWVKKTNEAKTEVN